MPFPPGFLWGVATSAYQIEGAVAEDGRGESIWDRFTRVPGAIERGANADVACDHYHRWREDVELMSSIGTTAYRFSIAWPRVVPDGRGGVNGRGLDFYARLVDALLDRGIVPVPTLYHWDLPAALQDRAGGWLGRETAERFAEYASVVFRSLGDRVDRWITLNEPWCSAFLGHYHGLHAPGVRDLGAAVRAAHHLLLAHARAVEAYRQLGQRGEIGITLDLQLSSPATDRDEDVVAARLSDGATNRWFLDPLLRGSYPADADALFESRGARVAAAVQPGDLAAISAPIDFLGVNYYFRRRVRAARQGLGWSEEVAGGRAAIPNEMGWNVDPDGLREQLERVVADYGPRPMYVTENGIALRDERGPDGTVNDEARIRCLREHLEAAEAAMAAGVDLRGWFVWSLLDNFEWAFGYRPRFGLVHVDFATQERTPKASARWYSEVIARNGRR